MSIKRIGAYGAVVLGFALAACGGQGSAPGPLPSSSNPGQLPPQPGPHLAPSSVSEFTSTATVSGTISSVSSGKVIVYTGSTYGYVPVYTNSSTLTESSNGATLKAGNFLIASGTGSQSSSITAALLGLYTSNPGYASFSGVVSSTPAYGLSIKVSSTGNYLPVGVTSSTKISGSTAIGTTVSVSSIGNTTAAAFASSISSSTSTPAPTPAPTKPPSSAQTHVLTGDYFMSPYGTTKVTPTQAAPYLTWAQTDWSNGNTIHAAGIKVQVYVDPNRIAYNDSFYQGMTESMFAHNCSGARIQSSYHGSYRYVGDPSSSALRSHYASYISSRASGEHVDALFDDDAGPLSMYSYYMPFSPSLPCSYTDPAWETNDEGLQGAAPIPVILNDENGLNGHNTSLILNELGGSKIMGGDYEHCFTDTSELEMNAWEWQAIENSQIITLAKGKQFFCFERNTNAASSSYPERIYSLASFLLTYDPSRSVLLEEFATNTGFHVLPESRLVPLSPAVAQPATVTSLLTTSGNYARQYNACYFGGSSVGPCAVVVNSDPTYSHSWPYPGVYGHTLSVSGSGVLDGGTASVSGSAPPSSVPPKTAYIAFK